MDSNLQLIGSIVIGSIFLLGVMSFYGNVIDFSHEKTFELLTQETTASIMEIIEHDFRRIGSGLQFSTLAILDSSIITFLGDVDQDGVTDTVRYFTSDTSAANATPNPNDIILYRVVNGDTTLDTPVGITAITVSFLDELGTPISDLMGVRTLEISLTTESPYPYDKHYTRAFWQERITPINLFRRSLTAF